MSNTKFAIALDHMKNDEFDLVYWPTVELALRIADKLMQEPTSAMIKAACHAYNEAPCDCENDVRPITAEFKAMRDAMLKEIDL